MKKKKEGKVPKKSENPNHPRKGDRIRVDPIRRPEDIESIKEILSNKPRDLLFFTMGVNSGLRAGDLLRLKVKEVRYLKEADSTNIREGKSGKYNILMVNKPIFKALKNYIEEIDPDDDDYLFASSKGKNAIVVSTVNALIKKWTKKINLKGNYGAHSLRKTFGYIQRKKYGTDSAILTKRFNHSNPAVTMRYLGITDKEVIGILMNEI
jgi:integrase